MSDKGEEIKGAKQKSGKRGKRFSGVYIEIGNICNLSCSFCAPTRRAPRQMSAEEFRAAIEKVAPYTDRVYMHVLGEPLCHPELEEMLKILREYGLKALITTNGTLLGKRRELLISNADVIERVSISLHSIEANGGISVRASLTEPIEFAKAAASVGIYTVFRLWNLDSEQRCGQNTLNEPILASIREAFPEPWSRRYSGARISRNIFLEFAEIFTWPCESTAEPKYDGYCHALSNHIAILADGTVVPCCLDGDGNIPLGNIFCEELSDILTSQRCAEMKRGFERGELVEDMCRRCTYARRFKKKGKAR